MNLNEFNTIGRTPNGTPILQPKHGKLWNLLAHLGIVADAPHYAEMPADHAPPEPPCCCEPTGGATVTFSDAAPPPCEYWLREAGTWVQVREVDYWLALSKGEGSFAIRYPEAKEGWGEVL